ncbi:hypothetical protein FHL15_011276 [Xylaria flabelliformis]|uniref:Uncharacterized protein n=1 Tax=Xylaria flabelliformis TaxID=2512241 RepID=A0A553HIV2_9PEZI|nr:hypothetical protein FHL15_011276 [Xylaria flabelliformis]
MATHQQAPRKIDLSTLQSAEIEHAKPGPQSPQLEKDAARAMAHTAEWQPSQQQTTTEGRRGYRQEDRRREMTMMGSSGGEGRQGLGLGLWLGFSEGRGA